MGTYSYPMSLSKHAYEMKLHSFFLLNAYHNRNHQFTKYMYMYNTQEHVRTLKFAAFE